ncbi:MAG TPA: DUF362 domain-containing protein [Methanocorpusculum sp.]|nr:DUF362 domain-containing protein [Methanocorpusculum sp.]
MKTITGSALCKTYERETVLNAVRKAIKAAGGLPDVKGKKVLIKPNLLSEAAPERAVTTHPSVIWAVGKIIKDAGGILSIADSPGAGIVYSVHSLKKIYKKCGIEEIAKDLGIEPNLDTGSQDKSFAEGVIMKRFTVINPVCNADIVISVCKLKTHMFTHFSGAVKNTFGVVPGLDKPVFHSRFPDSMDFSEMLVDLNELIKPDFCIMDAVVGMEGDGPQGGNPREVGYILASKSVYGLDLSAQTLISMSPECIGTTMAALRRGLIDEVCVKGDEIVPIPDFVHPSTYRHPENETRPIRKFYRKLQRTGKLYAPSPVINSKLCIGCGKCVRICPVKAASIKQGKASFDLTNCIRCYCCHEMCQYNAIELKRTLVGEVLHRVVR